jgi:hypothetical protein
MLSKQQNIQSGKPTRKILTKQRNRRTGRLSPNKKGSTSQNPDEIYLLNVKIGMFLQENYRNDSIHNENSKKFRTKQLTIVDRKITVFFENLNSSSVFCRRSVVFSDKISAICLFGDCSWTFDLDEKMNAFKSLTVGARFNTSKNKEVLDLFRGK